MQIKASNSQFKPKLLKIILTLLIILTAVQFTNPITAFASSESNSTNVTSLNGEAEHGYGSQVGKMHWAGKTERTGFLFYFVDSKGQMLTTDGMGLRNRVDMPVVIQVCNKDYMDEINKYTQLMYHLNYSHYISGIWSDKIVKTADIWYDDVPAAVQWDDDTGRWSGNGQDVAEWLFSECEDGNQMWENILLVGLKEFTNSQQNIEQAITSLKESERLSIVIEPIAANAIYSWQTWDDEANTVNLNLKKEEDFLEYIHPDNYKPALNRKADGSYEIIRVLSTASYMSEYVYKVTSDISDNKNPCPTGGANWKWTNEALPFCMTFQEPALGKEAIDPSTKPTRLDYETINNEKLSYGMGVITKEIKTAFIDSYDIDTNPEVPAPSQQPSEGDETKGECIITKVYYNKQIQAVDDTYTISYVGSYTTKDATGNINITNEKSKTGYNLILWGGFKSKIEIHENYNDFVYQFQDAEKFDDEARKMKFNDKKSGTEGQKYIYIVYMRTETTPPPSIQSHDFEIPESYITKQVYFSKAQNTSNTQNTAQKLTKNTFKWTSEAHNNCQGHEALTCTTPEHTHTTALSYRAGSINCGYTYEHTHSDGDSCIRYQYKCLAQSISQCIKNNQPSIPPNHKVF